MTSCFQIQGHHRFQVIVHDRLRRIAAAGDSDAADARNLGVDNERDAKHEDAAHQQKNQVAQFLVHGFCLSSEGLK